ncbi:MAG: UDP-3-O-acyl-N-acetylglucosamine deacetylase [Firmicutes bacterium]|nr:UDP-3-O-acyl-N-acetylglucosamine deacetylase [Bacillota bacterium]
MQYQQTIASELKISGTGLHSGTAVAMAILPQPVDTGILFRRSDLPDQPLIKADAHAVIDTRKSVTVGRDGWRIGTIEHLMAVFHGLGIDNALVEVDGAELPMGDGSALYFARLILEKGLRVQEAPRRYTYIREPLWVEGNVQRQDEPCQAILIGLPSDKFQVSFTFTSDHKATGTQFFQFTLGENNFLTEIAPARTIAFIKEIEYLRSQGLAMGNDLNSVVIVSEEGYENPLRFTEEIVRHKILDLIGDLYLAGPLIGHFIAIRSGHSLDYKLVKKIKEVYHD